MMFDMDNCYYLRSKPTLLVDWKNLKLLSIFFFNIYHIESYDGIDNYKSFLHKRYSSVEK